MPHINKILDHFKEAPIQNAIDGKVLTDISSVWKGQPLLLRLIKIDEEGLFAQYGELPIRIKLDEENKKLISPQHTLLWIKEYNAESQIVRMVYLTAKKVKVFDTDIDIAYTDSFISKQGKGFDSEEWRHEVSELCIFNDKSNTQFQYLCIQEFDNKNEAFLIQSLNRTLEVKIVDGKWTITKESTAKRMPKKHSEFANFSIYLYPTVRIIEKTKAGEAIRFMQQQASSGNTLMSLWQKYTELEVAKAVEFQKTFGSIKFKFIKHLPNKITQVQFLLTDEQRERLYSEKETLTNTALELESIATEAFGGRRQVFKIYSFLRDNVVEIIDEDFEIQKDGSFLISITGDAAIKKRRDYAYKQLIDPQNVVIRDLLFAIEGQDAMAKTTSHHQALTARTRQFLLENFGISDLNENQKKAIELALNTPDIAVIQGPPGTGKSTVIAAICDRIQEIAEKEEDDDKLILVSAFQNDTVEHISSKIKTMGLPTIKVGKEAVGVSVENEFINHLGQCIQQRLDAMPDFVVGRLSRTLKNIKDIMQIEHNVQQAVELINQSIHDVNLSQELIQEWHSHFSKTIGEPSDKIEKRLRALVIEKERFFIEGGNTSIRRLLMCEDFHPTQEERDWLDMETPRQPEDATPEFFGKLEAFRDKYLAPYNMPNAADDYDEFFVEDWIDRAIEKALESEKRLSTDKNAYMASVMDDIKSELQSSSKYIRRSIQAYSESIAATNQVAGGRDMGIYPQVQNVILEEAARSNPLDLIIPMVKATKRIILVGDHQQLPHLLEDDIAEDLVASAANLEKKMDVKETLKESLFGRIFNNIKDYTPKRAITLTEQFRMHPFIGEFISRVYYDGKLYSKSGLEELKQHGLTLSWAKDKVAIFVNVDRISHSPEKPGKSKSRKAEAVKVMSLIKDILKDPASANLSIGVITFYASQVTVICEEAVKNGYMERGNTGDYRINSAYQFTPDGREKLRIGSVDSFQGKEFDVVILSTVRSNDNDHTDMQKAYGFLSLTNRLNVAFSRAQKLLIVVGDGAMFNDDGAKEHVEGLYEFYTNLSMDKQYGNRI